MPPADPPALELRGVRAAYAAVEVLHGVDLVALPGRTTVVLGPNGAGKSTLLAVAAGLLAPTAGCRHVAGVHVAGAPADALARAGVCLVPERRAVFGSLTVRENLVVAARAAGRPRRAAVDAVLDRFPALRPRLQQPAGSLSGGQQQLLALARVVVTSPVVLLLDEPSAGLAPQVVDEVYEVLAGLTREGVAVVLVEQFVVRALPLADHVVVLARGATRLAGSPDEVARELHDGYLGRPA